jgi:uncharacterized protein YbaP (TraB family)
VSLRRLAALTLLVLLAPAIAWAKPPLWVAHGSGATVTLFGSVHVLPRGMDWEPDTLKQALGQADELWFETPIDAAALLEASRLALAQGLLPEGRSLSDLLSPDGKARLRRETEALRLPGPQLERLRPWLAELSLAERHAFETPAQQIAMFAGQPDPVQAQSLQDTLRELEEDPGQSRRLIDAWLKGDLKAIEKEGVEELRRESPEMFDTLLTHRNAAWLRTLQDRLSAPPAPGHGPTRIVVVVGVGHLTGPGGLPTLLRRKGFRVDGP